MFLDDSDHEQEDVRANGEAILLLQPAFRDNIA